MFGLFGVSTGEPFRNPSKFRPRPKGCIMSWVRAHHSLLGGPNPSLCQLLYLRESNRLPEQKEDRSQHLAKQPASLITTSKSNLPVKVTTVSDVWDHLGRPHRPHPGQDREGGAPRAISRPGDGRGRVKRREPPKMVDVSSAQGLWGLPVHTQSLHCVLSWREIRSMVGLGRWRLSWPSLA